MRVLTSDLLLAVNGEASRTAPQALGDLLVYLERARTGLKQTRELLEEARRHDVMVPALNRLEEHLEALVQHPHVVRNGRRVWLLNEWFEEVRSAMRLERWALRGRVDELDAAEGAEELSAALVEEVKETVESMGREARKAGMEEEWLAVVDRFDRHEETLWTCVDEDGEIVDAVENVVRVTNAIERDHRDVRAGVRRRTGREATRQELERVGEHLAVFSNMGCSWFVEHVLAGVDLRAAFLGLPEEEIRARLCNLRRKRFGERLPVAAGDREERLTELLSVTDGDGVEAIGQWTESVVA